VKTVALGEVAEIISGATPKTSNEDYWGGDILWATPADLSKLDGAYISSTPRTITKAGLRSCAAQVLPAGSVLLSSRAPIGHVAINTEPMATNQGFKSLIPRPDRADAKYLYHWLRGHTEYLQSLGNGATFKEVSKAVVSKVEIPLPPLDEQRRIASILDQADQIQAKRRSSIEQFDELAASAFTAAFGDDLYSPTARLDEVAVVSSGITKGRRTSEPTRTVPYLAVVNVQAGFLDLSTVKEIEATEAEIARYELQDGDLVLTEGGDPDKLGRGTVWRKELPLCLHQNHIFRVRVNDETFLAPEYLSAYMASRPARDYFLRSAKQTTGIASINMTQLRGLPVLVPTKEEQRKYLRAISAIRAQKSALVGQSAEISDLFASLQSRAFSGKL
jgi:type I restriction enzyme S subunit